MLGQFYITLTIVTLCILGVAYLHRLRRFLNQLKTFHASAWQEIGSPDFPATVDPSNSLRLLQFITKRSYARLDDLELTSLGDNLRIIIYVMAGGVLALALIALAETL